MRLGIDQATALAAWAQECLAGEVCRLCWFVDLPKHVGTSDAIGFADGYLDGRWTKALSRLHRAIEGMQGSEHATTELVLIVVCVGVGTEPKPYLIELTVPQRVDIALAAKRPPFGHWTLASQQEYKRLPVLPSTFFIDDIPF